MLGAQKNWSNFNRGNAKEIKQKLQQYHEVNPVAGDGPVSSWDVEEDDENHGQKPLNKSIDI